MQTLLNTLYVMTEGSYLHLDHETLKMEVQGEEKFRVPLHQLGGIVLFGNVLVSPFTIHRCAEEGKMLVLLSRSGRFKARVEGPVSGNVLLRRAQFQALDRPRTVLKAARNMVAGKVQNCRRVLLRAAREAGGKDDAGCLKQACNRLGNHLKALEKEEDLEAVRGLEGISAQNYFEAFGAMVRSDRKVFRFKARSRRPPRDPLNALLSFLYTLLMNDCISALESVGLDPQVGLLHGIRSGRPGLALDLMEEFRPVLADRTALSLINRRQLSGKDFEERPGGAVLLNEKGRKTTVIAYQKRKQEEATHPVVKQKVPAGLLTHLQARLLARFLRGDLEDYLPYLIR